VNKAIIGVGSNIKPVENIEKAKEIFKNEQSLITESKFVETEPEGYKQQPHYINGAFYIKTNLDIESLGNYLKEIEKRLGRIRTENKNAPRTIDLDIVIFNEEIIDNDFYRYKFVRNAVLELVPNLKYEN
jgi:2-amino-4-hydroxy-6-hydroxymethyldihydropteridine diphosphokinase